MPEWAVYTTADKPDDPQLVLGMRREAKRIVKDHDATMSLSHLSHSVNAADYLHYTA